MNKFILAAFLCMAPIVRANCSADNRQATDVRAENHPLAKAIFENDVNKVEAMLKERPERIRELIEHKSVKYSPLAWAVLLAREEIVRLFISKGADLEQGIQKRGSDGRIIALTPLMALMEGEEIYFSGDWRTPYNLPIAKVLLNAGAKLEAVDADGNTALFYAASSPENAKWIIAQGANPHHKNTAGKTIVNAVVNAFRPVHFMVQDNWGSSPEEYEDESASAHNHALTDLYHYLSRDLGVK